MPGAGSNFAAIANASGTRRALEPELTARYSHRRLYDLAGAVEKLPNLVPMNPTDVGEIECDIGQHFSSLSWCDRGPKNDLPRS